MPAAKGREYEVVGRVSVYTVVKAASPSAAKKQAAERIFAQGCKPDPRRAWLRGSADVSRLEVRRALAGCVVCGESLLGKRSHAIYCGPTCKLRAFTKRHRRGRK